MSQDFKGNLFSNYKENRVVADRYRIERKLGSGNFGTAFLVIDLKENNE